MARGSKIESSPHYNEIVDMLVAGYSGRRVSDYLLNEYGEKISHASLNRYKKDNLNVKAAVRQKIIEKEKKKKEEKKKKATQPVIEKEVEKEIKANESFELATDYRFQDIKKLDNIIEDACNVKVDLDNLPAEGDDKYDPYKEEDIKIRYNKLGLDAVKIKYAILDEDEVDVNHHVDYVEGLRDAFDITKESWIEQEEKNKE